MDLKEYRSTANKILVFDMLKIYSKVYNCLANYKMKCSKNEFANNHINGIENFWLRLRLATVSRMGYAKHRLSKFNG